MRTYKKDNELMTLLKLDEINRIICDTNMGTLKLRIRKGEKEYGFVLDSVELDKETNYKLFELLYPKTEGLFSKLESTKKEAMPVKSNVTKGDIELALTSVLKTKGRPKGSKNKK